MTNETKEKSFELSVALGDSSFRAAGSPGLVTEAFEEFQKLLQQSSARPPASVAGNTTAPKSNGGSSGKVSLPQLIKERGFKKNAEIAAAIVIWASDHDGKPSLTAPEIRTLWKGTPIKPPGNVNRDVETAAKQGWLEKNGRGYAPSAYGRAELGLS